MKNLFLIFGLLASISAYSQNHLEDLMAAGIEDAQRFAEGYISPGTEGMMHSMANGWIQSAEVKNPLRFEISIIGNAAFVSDKHRSFTVNTADYNNLNFRDGSTIKEVATAFGENDPEILVYSVVQNGDFVAEVEFELPQGLASVDMNILPTAFLQGRVGIFKGTEVKLRYFPKIEQEDIEIGLFGVGLQHEFTSWLPAEKIFPVAISGIVAYTNVAGNFDFTNYKIVTGNNQHFDLNLNTWLFQVQASTKMKVLNFYGGIGYVSGNSDFKVLGTYKVVDGIPLNESTNEFKDPFTVKNTVSDVRATIGTSLKLGFFGMHVDYNLAKFNNVSAGLHFGI